MLVEISNKFDRAQKGVGVIREDGSMPHGCNQAAPTIAAFQTSGTEVAQ
jgi:hypothetical protein